MFHLDHKLDPEPFIEKFFEVNRRDHERPPHPWETLFREGKCSREQLHGWGKERYYFTKQVPGQGIFDFVQLSIPGRPARVAT